MKRYKPRLPRAALGTAALAMAALTFGLLVATPAYVSSGSAMAETDATRSADSPAPVEVAISPARIDVVAQRDHRKGFGLVRHNVTTHGETKAQAI